jgi:TrmH family RNA methyltransferase
MEIIKSRANQTVKLLKKLNNKKFRKQYGLFLAEGHKLIDDCIRAGFKINILALAKSKAQEFQRFLPYAEKTVILDDNIFEYASQTVSPQGVLAAARYQSRAPQAPQKDCLILDNISDAGNLGAIIRAAAGAGIKNIYLLNCADAYSPKTVRSAMGGIFFVNIYEIGYDYLDAIAKNCEILGADIRGENYLNYTQKSNFALAIGNEANGLSQAVKEKCKRFLSIPMQNIESLNAAVSAGILIFYLKSL